MTLTLYIILFTKYRVQKRNTKCTNQNFAIAALSVLEFFERRTRLSCHIPSLSFRQTQATAYYCQCLFSLDFYFVAHVAYRCDVSF